ncbi:PadR family transcriptional regulator [Candidatus Bipolaricaulota bacterium]|nr:PadR family transcriptional regulator [Candidatus Bipolaricaulota bacterium]
MVGRGFLRYWVLRLLSEEPRTGYALAKELERRLGWRPSPGSLYPLLGTLAEQGLIVREGKGRGRWRLTSPGQEELARLEKGKEEWKTLLTLTALATKNIPDLSRFLCLLAQAATTGKISELSKLLPKLTQELEAIVGGEGDGSGDR